MKSSSSPFSIHGVAETYECKLREGTKHFYIATQDCVLMFNQMSFETAVSNSSPPPCAISSCPCSETSRWRSVLASARQSVSQSDSTDREYTSTNAVSSQSSASWRACARPSQGATVIQIAQSREQCCCADASSAGPACS